MPEVNLFKLDANNIIIHIRNEQQESTTTHNIPWNSIRSISVDNERVLIYHAHQQSIFNINGQLETIPEDMELS
jgi:hypothetical protein